MAADSHAALTGTIHTIGGSFTPGYVDGDNSVSLFNQPRGLALDSLGTVYVADFANNAIRKITADEVTSTFTRNVNGPTAVAVDSSGRVLVANTTGGNVVRFESNGIANQVIASGLASPTAVALDNSGNIYVALLGGTIRRFSSAGVSNQTYTVSTGAPQLRGLAVSSDGTLVVSDSGNHVLWKFPISGGTAFLLAGTFGAPGFAEGGVGVAKFNSPQQVAVSTNGIFVVADRLNHRVRAVNTDGVVTTLYGADPATWQGAPPETLPGWRDGSGDTAELHDPVGLTVSGNNTVYDSEVFYGVIRKATGLSFPTNAASGFPGGTGGGGTGGTSNGSTPNRISLGFASGEASSDFFGAGGQRFMAPVTLTLNPGQTIYGLQFNAAITNAPGTPSQVYSPSFTSMLMKPANGVLVPIPPAALVRVDIVIVPKIVQINGVDSVVLVTNYIPVFTSLVVSNSSGNFIGVGWLERKSALGTNLYDTISQDLIRYSQPHDYTFDGRAGKVVVGAVSFVIPQAAQSGNKYIMKLGRPSANSDGVAQDVVIETPDGSDTSLPISATRTLNIATRTYLVGDVLPFRWFNAGDFGDNSILNNDLLQLEQVFAYGFDSPPLGSDMYDALDSCCVSSDGSTNYSDPSSFASADESVINDIAYGDGILSLEDLYVTFRRSLDPSLVNYVRYWSNGFLNASITTNAFRGFSGDTAKLTPKKRSIDSARLDEPITARFTAQSVRGVPGQVVRVPVDVTITGPLPGRSILLKVNVANVDGTPAISTVAVFTPAIDIGQPTITTASTSSSFSDIWFEVQNPLAAGAHHLGTVDFGIPVTATADAVYSVELSGAEVSSGLTRFPVTVDNGLVLMPNRALAPWTDEIPDAWRVKYFGSLMNILSAPDADADGDGMTNLEEYRAGTNPNDITSRFALNGAHGAASVVLKWPTVAGKSYRLESASALVGAPWTVVEDNIAGTGAELQRTQSFDGGEVRFYRAHIVQ
jgi:hypothetical protein